MTSPTTLPSRSERPTPDPRPGSTPHSDWRHGGQAHALTHHSPEHELKPVPFLPQGALAVIGLVMLAVGLTLSLAAAALYAVAVDGQTFDAIASLRLAGLGLGGLTTSVVGGFLYAGSWLACLVEDNRAAARRLSSTLLVLVDVTAQATATNVDVGAVLVTAGQGTVVHRRDCPLVAYRPDLVPTDGAERHLSQCRVCQPATS